MSSWNRFKHGSKSFIQPLQSHLWSLFARIYIKSKPKLKFGKVIIDSNFYQIDSSILLEVISALYVPQLIMLT